MKIGRKSKTRIIAAVIVSSIMISMFAVLQSCENYIRDYSYVDSEGNVQFIFDDTPFEMQEPTDKLVVYTSTFNGFILNPAINIFKEKYPHVDIEVRNIPGRDAAEYFTMLGTELMAGKGPDIILEQPGGDGIIDTYKMMDASVFVDLNRFIEIDDEFNFDDYVKPVLDSGVYRGRRYLLCRLTIATGYC